MLLLSCVLIAGAACRPAAQPPPPAPPAIVATFQPADEQALIDLVNQERTKAGRAPLQLDPQLRDLAREWSTRMSDTQLFEHRDLLEAWTSRPGLHVYSRLGENIHNMEPDQGPERALQDWMASPPHRAAILDPDYTHIGIGVYLASDGQVWSTQNFGQHI